MTTFEFGSLKNFGIKITKVLTKSDIKGIISLKRKVKRKESGLFVVEGVKNVSELLCSNYDVVSVFTTDDTLFINEKTVFISEKELCKISHLSTPNKVLAVAKIPRISSEAIPANETILVIDGVNDPGNLGTIIRTADWFGIGTVVCSTDSVDCYNSKVIMATMGSLFRVNVHYLPLYDFLASRTVPIYGALLNGRSIYSTRFESPSVILMGSESHGIRKELLPLVTHPVSIPGASRAESLNLGVATGIFCSEYFRG